MNKEFKYKNVAIILLLIFIYSITSCNNSIEDEVNDEFNNDKVNIATNDIITIENTNLFDNIESIDSIQRDLDTLKPIVYQIQVFREKKERDTIVLSKVNFKLKHIEDNDTILLKTQNKTLYITEEMLTNYSKKRFQILYTDYGDKILLRQDWYIKLDGKSNEIKKIDDSGKIELDWLINNKKRITRIYTLRNINRFE
jgi:hypothetical protein